MKTRLREFLAKYQYFAQAHFLAIVALMTVAVLSLFLMGRDLWCAAGDHALWSSDIYSEHNSQHLFDPYTFTHVLHGIAFYALLWISIRSWTSCESRAVITIGLESVWEVLENTSFVIEKYRTETISLGYFGDSVINSLGDILACLLGYLLTMALPAWMTALLFISTEFTLVWWIRDSLILNIIMLIWPIDAIRGWQSGLE